MQNAGQQPPVSRDLGIMLVDLAVALAPVEKLTSANGQRSDEN